MGKKKSNEKKISREEENLQKGKQLHHDSLLFSRLYGSFYMAYDKAVPKDLAAVVNRNGHIFVNTKCYLEPKQWAYVLAHCQLHLAFGHFDAEKMPGYERINEAGEKKRIVSCDPYLWNMACDIYVSRFLENMKFGNVIYGRVEDTFLRNLKDEIQIYEYLKENHYENQEQKYGTAGVHRMDMSGLENPIVYGDKETNYFTERFAGALADSVSEAVGKSGGSHNALGKVSEKTERAAQWFISHYPLLGGIASGFKIIEDYVHCMQEDIKIAAVDASAGEIYLNPHSHLTEDELKFVLAHEFLHAGLQHMERCQGREPYLWNIACDYVINGWLLEMQIGRMPELGLLYDENLKGMSAEEIYDRILCDMRKYSKMSTFRGYGLGDMVSGRKKAGKSTEGVTLDEFYKSALSQGLEYHQSASRGYIPAGLIEEIKALTMPPISWDVKLAKWFEKYFPSLEKKRSYARPSRRQGSTPDIPRPRYVEEEKKENAGTFGVIIDTSGSMDTKMIGMALGSVASYSAVREVPYARVVFCDAAAYDAGYLSPDEIAGRVEVKGRGGTRLQPGIDLLEHSRDFPSDAPVLIITDAEIENDLKIHRNHAFLIPKGRRLPFRAGGEVFYFE